MTTTRSVVFVCLHGSAKSVIAAQYFRRLAEESRLGVGAECAGTEPDAAIPRHVVQGLLEGGFDVGGQRPRGVTREALANAVRIVTFGCELGAIAPPGVTIERWDDVPAVSEDFKKARDVIVARLPRLLDECRKSCS